mgnify:CR=1 FL=1
MRDGFIKVAAVTPDIRVADCEYNAEQICKKMKEAAALGSKIIVFPELCITGYTCEDLFWQEVLLNGAKDALDQIRKESREIDALVFVGLPWEWKGKLYNVAAAICHGRLLGLVPKKNLPNYSEFYEMRHFEPANEELDYIEYPGEEEQEWIPFGIQQIFYCPQMEGLTVAAEICEDLWVPQPPSITHAIAGANVIVNLSASDEITGKDSYRRNLVGGQSARLVCGYIYADAGEGESSTDLVFAGHNLIAENGSILSQSERFHNEMTMSELDLGRLVSERRRMGTFEITPPAQAGYKVCHFSFRNLNKTKLTRFYSRTPFVPSAKADRDRRCNEIFNIQAMGLKKRLAHTHCKSAVLGISGGLDSTLALLVTARAFDLLGLDRTGIKAITMPCFGTTDRTMKNACTLTEKLGASLQEIPIHEAVNLHFRDIGHDPEVHDVTYENSQARQRTLILMNIANQANGMVIGTGDMSELALGWATYNGDHMSMYGVNCSIPKMLVRYLVLYYAETTDDEELRAVLLDILDTPVSPELLPPKDGEISQKTEDLVGPYELHDFYLYYMMRFGYTPSKIYRLACYTFRGAYDKDTIYKWLRTFYWRFFSQQFKRSCLPDGPKVGSVALSPRGDWRMPSDASVTMWMRDLDQIKL